MELSRRLQAAKRDLLVPCVYHFYQRPPALVRGEGAYLFDAEGRRYLDCFAGVTVMNAGHSNPEIIEPAVEQLRRLQHTTTVYLTEPMLELAARLAELAPAGLRRSFFCASGSEANEGALLLAALATGRREVAFLDDGLHGRTKAAMSVTGLDMWRADPDLLATAHRVPGPRDPDSLPVLEGLLRGGAIAAVIAEPIQGNGGIIVPPDDYWPELRRLCTKYGALLIADEVQTAWNRTGSWFAVERWGVVPDVVTVAKALGNGFPIAAYLTTDELAARFTRPAAATFGGNLVSCRAALAVLDYHAAPRPRPPQRRTRRPPDGTAALPAMETFRDPRSARAGPHGRGRAARAGRRAGRRPDGRGAGADEGRGLSARQDGPGPQRAHLPAAPGRDAGSAGRDGRSARRSVGERPA